MKEIKRTSCWSLSHIYCTKHGYSNVKSAKLTFPEIAGYQMKYSTVQCSVMASRTSNQAWTKCSDAGTVHTANSNSRNANCLCSPF